MAVVVCGEEKVVVCPAAARHTALGGTRVVTPGRHAAGRGRVFAAAPQAEPSWPGEQRGQAALWWPHEKGRRPGTCLVLRGAAAAVFVPVAGEGGHSGAFPVCPASTRGFILFPLGIPSSVAFIITVQHCAQVLRCCPAHIPAPLSTPYK